MMSIEMSCALTLLIPIIVGIVLVVWDHFTKE